MDNEELRRYLQWMNKEYGDRGYSAGKGPPDMYGNQAISGEEGWSDIIRDQLRTNQFGDDLPSGLGLLSSPEDAEQVLGHRLVGNPGQYGPQSVTSGMRTDGIPVGPQLGEPNLGFASLSQPEEIFPPNSWDSGPAASSAFHAAEGELPLENPWGVSESVPEELWDRSTELRLGMETGPSATDKAIATAFPFEYGAEAGGAAGSQTALDSATALQGAEAGLGVLEGGALAAEEGLLAAEAAADSAWGGPATMAGNLALNMIPTRDRKKTKTPFGEEGSASGVLKGTGKGALLGATIGSAFAGIGAPVGALVGGAAGFVGGSQGYFDSTSAPQMIMSSIKRRGGGMQGGLLGGGSMYG
jgi:hypothetical protein